MVSSPVLALPDINDPLNSYELVTDASKNGFGATLSQIVDGRRRIISYYSKAVPASQRNYGATKLEFLALYNALMHYRIFLQGTKLFTVKTDCRSLLNLYTIFAKSNAYMARRLSELAGFNMKIVHVSGESNVLSDFLSRYPYDGGSRSKSSQTVIEGLKNGFTVRTKSNINKNCVSTQTVNGCEEIVATNCNIENDDCKKPLSLDDIREETAKDSMLSDVVMWLKSGKPKTDPGLNSPKELRHYYRKFELLSLKDGIIYLKLIKVHQPKRSRKVIVVPYSLNERVLYSYHDSLQSLHCRAELSLENCQEKFYFYKMKKEFELYVAACLTCYRNKQPKAYLRAPLKPVVYKHFNDAISLDHIEPSKTPTPRRNVALLTIVDMATNYTICVPVKSQSTPDTVKAVIEHWVCRFGVPFVVHSDNHSNFCSKLFAAIMSVFDIKTTRSTPYHSQGNGRAEAQNKRINAAMRVTLTEDQYRHYDLWIKFIMMGLNSLKSTKTGYSPNFLVFGRNLNQPRDWWMQDDDRLDEYLKDIGPGEVEKIQAYQLYKQVSKVTRDMQENSKRRAEYMSRQYNKKVHGPFFEKGDWCFLLVNVKPHKFADAWKGPYKVIKKINDWNYVVEIDNESGLTKLVSITKMKHYKNNANPYTKRIIDSIEKKSEDKKSPQSVAPEIESKKSVPKQQNRKKSANELGDGWIWSDDPIFIPRKQPHRAAKGPRPAVTSTPKRHTVLSPEARSFVPVEIAEQSDSIPEADPTEAVLDPEPENTGSVPDNLPEIPAGINEINPTDIDTTDDSRLSEADSSGAQYHDAPDISNTGDEMAQSAEVSTPESTRSREEPARTGNNPSSSTRRYPTRERKSTKLFGSPIPWKLKKRWSQSVII